MKIRIQSKSGNFNEEYVQLNNVKTLQQAMQWLRNAGGYYVSENRRGKIFVPFEEIAYISEE